MNPDVIDLEEEQPQEKNDNASMSEDSPRLNVANYSSAQPPPMTLENIILQEGLVLHIGEKTYVHVNGELYKSDRDGKPRGTAVVKDYADRVIKKLK